MTVTETQQTKWAGVGLECISGLRSSTVNMCVRVNIARIRVDVGMCKWRFCGDRLISTYLALHGVRIHLAHVTARIV